MKEAFPPIPDFLIRQKENAMTQPTVQKTQRKKIELPATLPDGIVLADQTIEQLIIMRDSHQGLLADVPRVELQLRAIRAEIRKKA
jgi:hypothetical protein